jgi:CrcB protein
MKKSAKLFSLVFIFGAIGCLIRYALSTFLDASFIGVFLANMVAAFLIGLFSTYPFNRQFFVTNREALTVGFCGGLSTYSVFELNLLEMFIINDAAVGGVYFALYFFATIICGILLCLCGTLIAKYVTYREKSAGTKFSAGGTKPAEATKSSKSAATKLVKSSGTKPEKSAGTKPAEATKSSSKRGTKK